MQRQLGLWRAADFAVADLGLVIEPSALAAARRSLEESGLDARTVPLGIQVEAFQRGLIPYIPALGPDGTEALGDQG